MDDWKAVDDLLMSQYRLGVEDALCHGCLDTHLPLQFGRRVRVIPRLLSCEREGDGGHTSLYEGVLTVDGVWYQFRCQIFVDGAGQFFLSGIEKFEAVEWTTQAMAQAG